MKKLTEKEVRTYLHDNGGWNLLSTYDGIHGNIVIEKDGYKTTTCFVSFRNNHNAIIFGIRNPFYKENIKLFINRLNPKVKFVDARGVKKSGKHRIVVDMIDENGHRFSKTIEHILNPNERLCCKICSRKTQTDNHREKFNRKWLSKINKEEGKFLYNKKVYYYSTITSNNTKKIALTGSSYINDMRMSIFKIILLVVGITFIIVSMVILIWSNSLVNKIKKLKEKIDNLNNDNYNHKIKYDYDDELSTLEVAMEKMRIYLKEEEEYKNQMYQNISHDFKTPITVMKSYIEAFEDGVITDKEAVKVSKEQLSKLEGKVHSLLYLNKLNYFKDKKDIIKERCDVSKVVFDSVDKFSLVRNNVKFTLDIDEKNTIFKGSSEMWEAIIDNILNNFIRYANKEIKITIKNNKIVLFNDGPNIDKDVLNNIFSPFEKGVNGVFGLGLSIVKKTLTFLNYDINIQNTKNGVKFIIS